MGRSRNAPIPSETGEVRSTSGSELGARVQLIKWADPIIHHKIPQAPSTSQQFRKWRSSSLVLSTSARLRPRPANRPDSRGMSRPSSNDSRSRTHTPSAAPSRVSSPAPSGPSASASPSGTSTPQVADIYRPIATAIQVRPRFLHSTDVRNLSRPSHQRALM